MLDSRSHYQRPYSCSKDCEIGAWSWWGPQCWVSAWNFWFTAMDAWHVFAQREQAEYCVYTTLCRGSPNLEERIINGDDKEVRFIADLVSLFINLTKLAYRWVTLIIFKLQKGSSGARSDDTKGLKGAILDWITPRNEPLNPPLSRSIKHDRGFHHERTGFLLCHVRKDWDNQEWSCLVHSLSSNTTDKTAGPKRNSEVVS